ncbi:hypothetical protein EVAR_42592_1 [Eumeta japonica]|uniref:Uncharacterized protein n=1 Tax=Eumeta variegata TaxID=151549 RepID=A0A4C1XNS7_EUMVA|nr:hypothetical protein EVAR_42592_1 [Eumeta japonica]
MLFKTDTFKSVVEEKQQYQRITDNKDITHLLEHHSFHTVDGRVLEMGRHCEFLITRPQERKRHLLRDTRHVYMITTLCALELAGGDKVYVLLWSMESHYRVHDRSIRIDSGRAARQPFSRALGSVTEHPIECEIDLRLIIGSSFFNQ